MLEVNWLAGVLVVTLPPAIVRTAGTPAVFPTVIDWAVLAAAEAAIVPVIFRSPPATVVEPVYVLAPERVSRCRCLPSVKPHDAGEPTIRHDAGKHAGAARVNGNRPSSCVGV